jgi:hypothetical protein
MRPSFAARLCAPWAIGAALLLLIGAQASSCVSLYDLEGYGEAVSQLCERISTCYGAEYYPDCLARAGARLEAAPPDSRQQFLNTFADSSCLENCTNAKACLDAVPICGASTSSCAVPVHCCGFWQTGAVCEDTTCCSPVGVGCTSDAECCGEVKCIESEGQKTCGGVECAARDQPCATSADCCGSLLCSPSTGLCTSCIDNGLPCSGGGECCSRFCNTGVVDTAGGPEDEMPPEAPLIGVCDEPPCGFPGTPCETPSECCEGTFCVPISEAGIGVCNTDDCLPLAFPCARGKECCSGVCDTRIHQCVSSSECSFLGEDCDPNGVVSCCDGFCDQDVQHCCRYGGAQCGSHEDCCDGFCAIIDEAMGLAVCVDNGMCAVEGENCGGDDDCCSHSCDENGGACCPATSTACGHGVCSEGEALDPECSHIMASEMPEAPGADVTEKQWGDYDCIQTVCNSNGFGYCCCNYWDLGCVLQASATPECNVTCVDAAMPE